MEESVQESKPDPQQGEQKHIKCSKHIKYDKEFINTQTEEGQTPLICFCCLQSQGILNQVIHINEIEAAKEETILLQIPPLMKEETDKILEEIILQNGDIIEQSSEFFSNLRKKISETIDLVETSHKSKMIKLVESKNNILQIYNKISQKEELQRLITEHKKGGDIDSQLQEIFKNMKLACSDNQMCLDNSIDEYNLLKNNFNFINLNQTKDVIIELISQLAIPSEDIQQISDSSLEQKQEQEGSENIAENKNEQPVAQEKSKQQKNLEILMSLIQNPTNYCSKKLLEQVDNLLHCCSPMLSNIEFDLTFENQEKSGCFRNISNKQLEDLRILAKKIFEISAEYNQLDESVRYTYDDYIQPISSQIIKNLDQVNLSETIKAILFKYPIFELSTLNWTTNLMSQWSFQTDPYQSSIKLIQMPTLSYYNISQSAKVKERSWANSNLIDEASYIVRFQYIPRGKFNESYFSCGLVPQSQMKQGIISSFKLCFSSNLQENNLNRKIKGKDMQQMFRSSNPTEMELRICVSKKYMRIADYPKYENVCEISDTTVFDSTVYYRFCMSYQLQDSVVMINTINQVTKFDQKM